MAAPEKRSVCTKDEKEDDAALDSSRKMNEETVGHLLPRALHVTDDDDVWNKGVDDLATAMARSVYVVTKEEYVPNYGENADLVVAVEAVYDDAEAAYEHAVMRSLEELGDGINPQKTDVLRRAVASAATWADKYDAFDDGLLAALPFAEYTGDPTYATFTVTKRPLQSQYVAATAK
jgi:hypothetical protein